MNGERRLYAITGGGSICDLAAWLRGSSPPSLGQSGRRIEPMNRLHQVLLIGTFLPLCWMAMMAVHELGHVVAAVATGGKVEKVVLHPLMISRTDVSPNPSPLIVVWAGPIVGVSEAAKLGTSFAAGGDHLAETGASR